MCTWCVWVCVLYVSYVMCHLSLPLLERRHRKRRHKPSSRSRDRQVTPIEDSDSDESSELESSGEEEEEEKERSGDRSREKRVDDLGTERHLIVPKSNSNIIAAGGARSEPHRESREGDGVEDRVMSGPLYLEDRTSVVDGGTSMVGGGGWEEVESVIGEGVEGEKEKNIKDVLSRHFTEGALLLLTIRTRTVGTFIRDSKQDNKWDTDVTREEVEEDKADEEEWKNEERCSLRGSESKLALSTESKLDNRNGIGTQDTGMTLSPDLTTVVSIPTPFDDECSEEVPSQTSRNPFDLLEEEGLGSGGGGDRVLRESEVSGLVVESGERDTERGRELSPKMSSPHGHTPSVITPPHESPSHHPPLSPDSLSHLHRHSLRLTFNLYHLLTLHHCHHLTLPHCHLLTLPHCHLPTLHQLRTSSETPTAHTDVTLHLSTLALSSSPPPSLHSSHPHKPHTHTTNPFDSPAPSSPTNSPTSSDFFSHESMPTSWPRPPGEEGERGWRADSVEWSMYVEQTEDTDGPLQLEEDHYSAEVCVCVCVCVCACVCE